MDKLQKVLSRRENYDEDSSTGIFSNLDSAVTLNWTNRITAFVICFIIGIMLSLVGSLALFLGKGIALFAVCYTLGNVVSLASTCFLMGPLNQLKKMFASTRIVATIMIVVMIILTFLAGAVWKKNALSLLCMILQFLAMTWYSLSYIPFARDAVKKSFSSCV